MSLREISPINPLWQASGTLNPIVKSALYCAAAGTHLFNINGAVVNKTFLYTVPIGTNFRLMRLWIAMYAASARDVTKINDIANSSTTAISLKAIDNFETIHDFLGGRVYNTITGVGWNGVLDLASDRVLAMAYGTGNTKFLVLDFRRFGMGLDLSSGRWASPRIELVVKSDLSTAGAMGCYFLGEKA